VKEDLPPVSVIVLEMEIVPEAAEVFRFPAASENEFAATTTVPVPLDVSKGV